MDNIFFNFLHIHGHRVGGSYEVNQNQSQAAPTRTQRITSLFLLIVLGAPAAVFGSIFWLGEKCIRCLFRSKPTPTSLKNDDPSSEKAQKDDIRPEHKANAAQNSASSVSVILTDVQDFVLSSVSEVASSISFNNLASGVSALYIEYTENRNKEEIAKSFLENYIKTITENGWSIDYERWFGYSRIPLANRFTTEIRAELFLNYIFQRYPHNPDRNIELAKLFSVIRIGDIDTVFTVFKRVNPQAAELFVSEISSGV